MPIDAEAVKKSDRSNRKVVVLCVSIFSVMLGLAFASVPLYDLFCRVTGYGGTTQVSDVAPKEISDQTILVKFDANVNGALGWSFKPEVTEVRVRIGEVATVNYIAQNRTARTTFGSSTFNVTPGNVGQYFSKIQCFCFTEQKLEAGEMVKMPVQFYVDPAILADEDANEVHSITLSYTFFKVDHPESLTVSSLNGQ